MTSSLRNSYHRQTPASKDAFVRPVTDDGTILGASSLAINGSLTPVEFWIQPTSIEFMTIEQINVVISDVGGPAATDYGNLSGPLANGLQFFVDLVIGKSDLVPVCLHSNQELVLISSTFDVSDFAAGSRVLKYRDLLNEYSVGFELDGSRDEKLGVRVQDDLSALGVHRCFIKGFTQLITV